MTERSLQHCFNVDIPSPFIKFYESVKFGKKKVITLKGRVGVFGKASDSKLALKARSPPSLHYCSAKPHLPQNTQTCSERPETNLRQVERWCLWRIECNAVRLPHISITGEKTLQYKAHNVTIIAPFIHAVTR